MEPSSPLTGVVWTHIGDAHLDELLTIAIVDAYVVEVREIKRVSEEMLKPEAGDIVVDIGSKYGKIGEALYFDHHHSAKLKCSAWLVAECIAQDILKDIKMVNVLNLVDTLDRKGIVGFGNLFRTNSNMYVKPVVFLLSSLTRTFEEEPLTAVKQLSRVLKERKHFMENIEESVKRLRTVCEDRTINGFKVLIVPEPDQCGVEPDLFEAAQGAIELERGSDIICCWNERTEFRTRRIYVPSRGKVNIDLNKARDNTAVEFCHPRGFLANLKVGSTLEMCINIVEEATRC